MKLVHDPESDPTVEAASEDRLSGFIRTASIELTPRHVLGKADLLEWLSPGTVVYVPYLPNADYADTIAACHHLCGEGLAPVPHVPARAIQSLDHARGWLDQLQAIGVTRLMLIAGDNGHPAGPFKDTLALLQSGLLTEYRFALGVAGHPDGHPAADHATLIDALRFKRDYAAVTGTRMWIVTQFAFEADTFTGWLQSAGDAVAPLPVWFGIAGPTSLRALMSYAAKCGVGVSARALLRHPETARLLRAWTPDGLVHALARYQAEHPLSLFRGIHIFPFGGLKRSAQWLDGLREQSVSGVRTESLSGG